MVFLLKLKIYHQYMLSIKTYVQYFQSLKFDIFILIIIEKKTLDKNKRYLMMRSSWKEHFSNFNYCGVLQPFVIHYFLFSNRFSTIIINSKTQTLFLKTKTKKVQPTASNLIPICCFYRASIACRLKLRLLLTFKNFFRNI